MIFSHLRFVLISLVILVAILSANVVFFGGQFFDLKILAIYVGVTLFQVGFDIAQRRKASLKDGWHQLAPSPMEWFALIGSFALTCLFLYIFFFVGSARADAAQQMTVLKWLIAAFALGTALVFYGSFASSVRWNDEQIEQHGLFKAPVIIRWTDLEGVEMTWAQAVRLVSRDGTKITFSPYQNGTASLGQAVADQLSPQQAE